MKWLTTLVLVLYTSILTVWLAIQSSDIRNLEQKYCKIKYTCDIIMKENQQLQRINNQNLRILAEGGWDAYISSVSTSD